MIKFVAIALAGLALASSFSASAGKKDEEPPPPPPEMSAMSGGSGGITEPQEWAHRVKTAESIGALGINLFGDSTNYYNGTTSFAVTDIDIPGNSALPVRLGRTITAAERDDSGTEGLLSDWDLDVPYMSGVYSAQNGWNATGGSGNRCSGSLGPSSVTLGSLTFQAREFWRGVSVHVPGAGTQTVLNGATTPIQWPGGVGKVTKEFWKVNYSCPPLANATGGIFIGEGFVALAPDGTKYTFNHMVTRWYATLVRDNGTPYQELLPRIEVRLYATKVVDRFGNEVNYTWSGNKLTKIEANDGRSITLEYDGAYLAQATTSCASTEDPSCTRTWLYDVGPDGHALTVTQPDGKIWTSTTPLLRITYNPASPHPDCWEPDDWLSGTQNTWSFTHPSGASGAFTFTATRHARSEVPTSRMCYFDWEGSQRWVAGNPIETDNFALTGKSISGPNIPAAHL